MLFRRADHPHHRRREPIRPGSEPAFTVSRSPGLADVWATEGASCLPQPAWYVAVPIAEPDAVRFR
jgi:hypothetical protein